MSAQIVSVSPRPRRHPRRPRRTRDASLIPEAHTHAPQTQAPQTLEPTSPASPDSPASPESPASSESPASPESPASQESPATRATRASSKSPASSTSPTSPVSPTSPESPESPAPPAPAPGLHRLRPTGARSTPRYVYIRLALVRDIAAGRNMTESDPFDIRLGPAVARDIVENTVRVESLLSHRPPVWADAGEIEYGRSAARKSIANEVAGKYPRCRPLPQGLLETLNACRQVRDSLAVGTGLAPNPESESTPLNPEEPLAPEDSESKEAVEEITPQFITEDQMQDPRFTSVSLSEKRRVSGLRTVMRKLLMCGASADISNLPHST